MSYTPIPPIVSVARLEQKLAKRLEAEAAAAPGPTPRSSPRRRKPTPTPAPEQLLADIQQAAHALVMVARQSAAEERELRAKLDQLRGGLG